jgi:hypothetical protein
MKCGEDGRRVQGRVHVHVCAIFYVDGDLRRKLKTRRERAASGDTARTIQARRQKQGGSKNTLQHPPGQLQPTATSMAMRVAGNTLSKLAMPNTQGPHWRGMVTLAPAPQASTRDVLGIMKHWEGGGVYCPTQSAFRVTVASVQELRAPAQFCERRHHGPKAMRGYTCRQWQMATR